MRASSSATIAGSMDLPKDDPAIAAVSLVYSSVNARGTEPTGHHTTPCASSAACTLATLSRMKSMSDGMGVSSEAMTPNSIRAPIAITSNETISVRTGLSSTGTTRTPRRRRAICAMVPTDVVISGHHDAD